MIIIYFIGVTIINVFSKNKVEGRVVGEQVELVQYSWKLVFGDVAIFSSVEILEMGLHQDAFVLNFGSEMSDDLVKFILIIIIQILGWNKYLVFTSGGNGGFTVDLLHLEKRVFVDVVLGENLIHIVNKLFVIDQSVFLSVSGHESSELGGV